MFENEPKSIKVSPKMKKIWSYYCFSHISFISVPILMFLGSFSTSWISAGNQMTNSGRLWEVFPKAATFWLERWPLLGKLPKCGHFIAWEVAAHGKASQRRPLYCLRSGRAWESLPKAATILSKKWPRMGKPPKSGHFITLVSLLMHSPTTKQGNMFFWEDFLSLFYTLNPPWTL